MLLDSAVQITDNWLSGMLACLSRSSDSGIVGPVSNGAAGRQKAGADGAGISANPDEFAKAFTERNGHRRAQADTIEGFCMLFRRSLLEKIGPLDEKTFKAMPFADADYSLRASLEGFRNFIAADVFLYMDTDLAREDITEKNTATASGRSAFAGKWNTLDPASPASGMFSAARLRTEGERLSHLGDIEKAVTALVEAAKIQPMDKRAYYQLADVLMGGKEFANALKVLDSMPQDISFNGDPVKTELAAYCKEGLGLYEEAASLADKALEIDGSSARAWNLKGVIAFKKGVPSEAGTFFKKAIELDNGFAEAYGNLGAVKWFAEDKRAALELFEKAFVLNPVSADAQANYLNAIIALSELEKGVTAVKEASGLYPLAKRLRYMLAGLLQALGRNEEAMSTVEDAIASFGLDGDALSTALSLRELIGPMRIDGKSGKTNTVSLCMIVKDEERHLARCLMSARPAVDEMIVVDTGSTDRTKEVARYLGAQVYEFAWTDSFSDARNFSLSKAQGKWIFVLDGDEVISSLDYGALRKAVNERPAAYSFMTRNYVQYSNITGWTANDWKYAEEGGSGWIPSKKVRLFPNDKRIRFENPVHEFIEQSLARIRMTIKPIDVPIHHYGKLDMEKTVAKGENYFKLGIKKIEEKGEKDYKALLELAVQSDELRKYEEGTGLWKRVTEMRPDAPLGFHCLGNAYYQLGRYDESALSLERAMKLSPSRDTIQLYASCKIFKKEADAAIPLLEQLLKKETHYPMAQGVLMVACLCTGRKEKGLEHLDKLRTLWTNLDEFLEIFGRKLLDAGNTEYATRLLEAVVEAGIMGKGIPLLLADCYIALARR